MNIFEKASRLKLSFSTDRGILTIDQLWDVPLRSTDKFNLDVIAGAAHKALEAASEVSFVDTATKNPARERLALGFEIIKHVIDVKLTEEKARIQAAANRAEKAKLLEILAEKQEGKLTKLSESELKKRIEELS